MMRTHLFKLTPETRSPTAGMRRGMLQRTCACGGTPGPTGACERCRQKRLSLQRQRADHAEPAELPAIVNQVLRSPGQLLDTGTRTLFESRFGHNFSRVRVHADARAAASAQAVRARAYTVGWNVVFGNGQYRPGTAEGKRLLAHELAHVVQQGGAQVEALRVGQVDSPQEHEAERLGQQVAAGGVAAAPTLTAPAGLVQRQPEWWRRFLENNRLDFTVISPFEVPVAGTPRAGVRRNPDGTWTVIAGNEKHTVGLDEIDDILGSIGRGRTTPGGPTGPVPPIGPSEPFDPSRFACPPAEYYDFLRRRCMPEVSPPSGFTVPELTLPEFPRLPRRPGFTLLGIESVVIDHFALDSAAIPGDVADELDHLVTLLNAHPDADVYVDGHTDSSGTKEHNQRLSEGRAGAVRDELVRRGVVNPERLRARGLGERILLNPEERSEGERAQNRRVEVWFLLPPGEVAERFKLRLPGLLPLLPELTPPGPISE